MHRRPPLPVIIIVIAILATGAYFIFTNQTQAATATGLTASGTVETTQVSIASEVSGKLIEVYVDEGDFVKAGDILFRLDDTLLLAQRDVATAGLDTAKSAVATAEAAATTAQAQYDLALAGARAESAALRSQQWQIPQPGDFDQPAWYFTKAEQTIAAEAEIRTAADELARAEKNLADVQTKASNSDFSAAETNLAEARAGYRVADDVKIRADATSDDDLKEAAQKAFDAAQTALTDAQDAYDALLDTDSARDVLQARAELAVAQERLNLAQERLLALQTGEASLKVAAAQKVLEQAQTAAAQAHQAVGQAEANLKLLTVQLDKLTVRAPEDGMIVTRNIEPGEMVLPAAVALVLGRNDALTITVYVPEDRVGEVNLGQAVDVKVDSYPDQTFSASVIHISDQAEFTPRNVQTVAGRKSTVFAIKLKLNDTSGKLKPGMPADVTFK